MKSTPHMTTLAVVTFLVLSSACGGSPPAAAPVTTMPSPTAAARPPAKHESRAVPYFALVGTEWMGRHLRVSDSEVEAWAADEANAKSIAPNLRHILIRLDSDAKPKAIAAATKRANAILARIQHGEDFAKVADEVSEDYGTQKAGGVLPGGDLSIYVEPFRDAAAALAPGEVTKKLVRTVFGLHIIKKEKVDADARRAAYRRAHAKAAAQALAASIAVALKDSVDPARAVTDATASVVDAEALADESRPQLTPFPADADAPQDPACEHVLRTNVDDPAGVAPLEQADGFVVTIALDASFHTGAKPAACSLGAMEEERIRKAIERIRSQQDAGSAKP